jgi:NADH dehydrogenase [ubiquinone] 1 alpha subcomplex assembly factor 7
VGQPQTGRGDGGVSTLKQRIAEIISRDGPVPVSLYMSMCLHDPRDGYYATRAGFNRDFTTAPETSQVFGELIGVWTGIQWTHMGLPNRLNLIEIGPGRGTMMKDMLRMIRIFPRLSEALDVTLVEASPLLREQQKQTLAGHDIRHVESMDDAPPGPAIIIGNEFLDCLPIRQFVRRDGAWRERQVGLNKQGELVFGLSPPVELPPDLTPTGDEVEHAPALELLVDKLTRRFADHPGRALFVDYGPAAASPTDTLRAYSQGQQVHPLADPGGSDLTADVDFARLAHLARTAGLHVDGPLAQGEFLNRLGAGIREKALGDANPARAREVSAAIETLVSPTQMGERFQVIAISAPTLGPAQGVAG